MRETPVQERQERAAETVQRHAHILWIDHGGGGHGYLHGGSRAFSRLAVSLAGTTEPRSPDTTPGELLAAAALSSFAVTLAGLLPQRGTPAPELGVDATCPFDESECGQTISGLHVRVRGRGAGLETASPVESAHLALACYPISHALSPTVTHTIDIDLVGGM